MDWFIAEWPDGDWCDWDYRHQMTHRSDDFYRLRVLVTDRNMYEPLLTAPAPLVIYVDAAGVARFSLCLRIPAIQMRVDIPAEQISAAITLRQEEIAECIREGVRRAVSDAAEVLVKHAHQQAASQIEQEINQYFAWGEGREAIKAVVLPALAKITQKILKEKS